MPTTNTIDVAQAEARTALRAYEAAGRAVVNIERQTPAERQAVHTTRDAYYRALSTLNALRGE